MEKMKVIDVGTSEIDLVTPSVQSDCPSRLSVETPQHKYVEMATVSQDRTRSSVLLKMQLSVGTFFEQDGWLVFITHSATWKSYYMVGIIITLVISAILTYTIGDIDWEDNIIYNKFGFNSLCLILDYPPVIYVGPFMYSICLIFMGPYCLCQCITLNELYGHEKLTLLSYRSAMISIVLEMLTAAAFSTIFAVNVESVSVHVHAYILLLMSFCLSSARSLLMERHLKMFKGWKSRIFWAYHILLIFFVLLYGIGTFITLNWDTFMWVKLGLSGAGTVVDRIATILLICKVFTAYFTEGKMEFRARSLLVPLLTERETLENAAASVQSSLKL